MRYLAIFTPGKNAHNDTPEHQAAMGKLVEESMKSGELIMTGGLLPCAMGGARVRSEGGEITVVDGPYAEAKEAIVGYAILSYPTKEAAIAGTKRFMKVAGEGECVLRQLMDGPPEKK